MTKTEKEILLDEIACGVLRAQLAARELKLIGTLVQEGWMTPDKALEELQGCGCIPYLEPVDLVTEAAMEVTRAAAQAAECGRVA